MTTLRDAAYAVLAGDSTLAALVPGGIYTRQISAIGTPDAIAADGKPANHLVLKTREIGPVVRARFADTSTLEIWIRTRDTDAGDIDSDAIESRIRTLLSGAEYTAGAGTRGTIERRVGDTGILDDPGFAFARIRTIRYQATSVWSVPE
jgi:hypothetical protein